MDTKMDTADETPTEGMKTEIETKPTVDKDFSAVLSEKTHQHLMINERPSSSCRKVRARSRPTFCSTKSFPPFSWCIGGLGEDGEWDDELDSEKSIPHQQHPRHNEMKKQDTNEVFQGSERKDAIELTTRCSKDEVKAKWRAARKGRIWGSYEADRDRWERGRWNGKGRVEETGGRKEHDDKEREGGTNSECKHCRNRNSSFETEIKEEGAEGRKRSSISAEEEENKSSGETLEGKDEEAEELPGVTVGSTKQHWSSPHPILSKLLQSSSSTSSFSSMDFSSDESYEVLSEEENVGKKRETLRKCRSWKTFLTLMYWSPQQQSSWVQLAGHQGNFQLSDGGEVLKLYSEVEANCLNCLMRDPLRPFVPQYHGTVTRGESCYVRLEDLLHGLRRPIIMDCKMGVRTFQEEELAKARTKATLRNDMYHKMVKVDPSAPSAEEHAQKGVTKWRYLEWRDKTSSTSTLGFRIEGIMMEDGSVQRDFRKIRTVAQATEALLYFTESQLDILKAYHYRLLSLSDALTNSPFFRSHEVIGSSLLFVHDHSNKANVWMIDFGKTTPVPDTRKLQHNVPWAEGSSEDGYLIGLTSLITSLSQAINVLSQQESSVGEEKKSVT